MSTVWVGNQWYDVDYRVVGKYYPASFEYPEEMPDFEVSSVITCTEDGDRYEVTGDELEAIAAELDAEIWQLVMDGDDYVD